MRSYTFGGGTQITFTEPPKAGSKLQILFFRGSNDDVDDGNPFLTVKKGDLLQLQELQEIMFFKDQEESLKLQVFRRQKLISILVLVSIQIKLLQEQFLGQNRDLI